MRLLAAAARKAGVAAFVMVFLFSYAGPGSFASVPRTERIPRSAVNEPIRLMVQLQAAPLADDAPGRTADRTASLEAEQVAFRARLRQAGLEYREVSAHKTLFNGLTIRIRPGDLGRVAGLRGVRAVFVAQKTKAPRPQLASSVGMVGGHQAWAGDPAKAIPGVDGTGITVAVIDTGIDYLHPDLGGCLGPDCRVIGGRDFVGDEFDGSNEPVPDDDPMDVNGHGTHVAGIIGARAAGEDGVTGVAPGVKFLALKVFGAGGHTWDDIILQALEAAYEMGADVINMSIGSAFQWPQYPTAQAVQHLANRGIVVATSAGNSGEAGEFATGAPAVAPGNMAVASFENDFVRRRGFMLPDGTIIGYGVMEHSPDPPGTGESSEVVYAGLGRSDEEFLNPDGTSRVDGKVALISRGAITFREKTLNAMRHGAVQVVIFNSVNGFFRGTMGSTGEYLPTLSISRADGLRLKELAEAGSLRLTWTEKLHLLANDTAGLISDFSSWGPSPDLAVKPDLTAPGGSIYSTFPLAYGGYATLSGTSMAAPHVAGAAALILQARRAMVEQDHAPVKPTAVRTLLMNTAFPRTKGPGSEQYYPVHRQGAGMMDAWRAINARQRVLPEKIAFGAVKGGTTVVESFMIENLSAETQTFTFRALGDGDTTSVQVAAEPEALQVGARRTGRATLSLTVPEDLPQNAIFSGWVAVLNSDEEIVAHVPYLGYNGDYQAASALDPLPYGLPWLARLDEGWLMRSREIEIRPGCGCDAQWAWILFSLARQPQELRMEIWNADTGRKWGNTFTASYLGRSDGGIEVFVWNAETDKGRQVPAGTYVLQLKALRPLGDRFNPDHWDVWTSGRIRVVWD